MSSHCPGGTMQKAARLFRTALAIQIMRCAYSAAFGKAIAGSVSTVGASDEISPLPRRNSRLNKPRRAPGLTLARVNTISIDGVTTSVSTVAKDRPKTIAEDSEIHHCVDGALIVVS